jgi:molybdopterin-containing oxidoreductase family iron-sulfur binding subunit
MERQSATELRGVSSMKRVFQHPDGADNGRNYWRSLEQRGDTPEYRHWLDREFPEGASEPAGEAGGVSRREFVRLMGASVALAGVGLSACRRREKYLVPVTRTSEWAIPGKPVFFATSMPSRRGAVPLVVTTHDGRPTKLEGNPLYEAGKGGTNLFAQASVLDLYDPERSARFLEKGEPSDAAAFGAYLDEVRAAMERNGGRGLAILTEENPSPTRERLRAEFLRKYPSAKWAVYEPAGNETQRQAWAVGHGPGVRARALYGKADVILSFDADFLGNAEGRVEDVRAFSDRRRVEKPGDPMNRLYIVENRYTVTGGMADHRLRCPASHLLAAARAVADRVAAATGDAGLKRLIDALSETPPAALDGHWIEECANDLVAAKGRSLVVAGERLPAAAHLLAAGINAALGNFGKTVVGIADQPAPAMPIGELAEEIESGRITHLVIVGGNPAYNAPSDLGWATLQGGVADVVRVGLHEDETSRGSRWHVPGTHYLESWGDARTADGTYVSVQPMIHPLYGGWSELDLLARWLGQPKPEGPELVQETFRALANPDLFDAAWTQFLHDGFSAAAASGERPLHFDWAGAEAFARKQGVKPVSDGSFEVVFAADSKLDDGRYNNNAWLQEVPDPVAKTTWDNAAWLSPATAKQLGLSTKSMETIGVVEREIIEIAFADGRKLELPAFIAPGHADHSITVPLGYGRSAVGKVGAGTGFDAYPLRTAAEPYIATGATVSVTGKRYAVAVTQDHYSMEGRDLVREAGLEDYENDPAFAKTMGMDSHIPGNVSLYTHPPMKDPNQWGMVVDLNLCTGCNACVAACQAENNIPVVGKEQVINGRAMHWIRLDRYFAGDDINEPDMVTQPMLCQQCESAPCETVCPVNATVHSDDGLNVMAYNRCIGTRYCANNCPFKVRRFNFFDYHQRPVFDGATWGRFNGKSSLYDGPTTEKRSAETLKMQKNPNVTVRMRGVMEKCTFCLQRVQEARIATKVKAGATAEVVIPPDSFQVACQQACPAGAITFGDIKNGSTKVSKLRAQEKGYRLLEYLNIASRITYLARLRNPNPKMPGGDRFKIKGHGPGGHGAGDVHGIAPGPGHGAEQAAKHEGGAS